jgi:hypothetical protein
LWVGPSLVCKHWTRDKHSSLIRKYVYYSHKKFYSTSPARKRDDVLPVNKRYFFEQLFDDGGAFFCRQGEVVAGKRKSDGDAENDDEEDDRQETPVLTPKPYA